MVHAAIKTAPVLRHAVAAWMLCAIIGCGGTPTVAPITAGPEAWRTSGQVLYSNEYHPLVGEPPLPFILGGTDVSPPTAETLARYQARGNLLDIDLPQLQAMYQAEGILWSPGAWNGIPGKHVLEGGRSMVTPLPGTLGYTRLFCRPASPYQPRSELVKAAALRLTVDRARKGSAP